MKAAPGRAVYLNDVPLGKGRIQSLSDAVIAVSMGVMVLQLAIPVIAGGASQDLLFRLSQMAPAFLVCAGGFVAVAALWHFQHLTFHFIRHTNGVLLWLNLFFLMFVAALPFSVFVLGRYPMSAAAQLLFFGHLLAMSVTLNWHWYYAIRRYMVAPEMDVDIGHRLTGQLRLLPAACVLALALAPIRADVAYFGFGWVLLMGPIFERFRKPKDEPIVRRSPPPE